MRKKKAYEKQSVPLQLRFTPAEAKRVWREAKVARMKVATFVREIILKDIMETEQLTS